MPHDLDDHIVPPEHDDPGTHARDAVEAMRAAGTDRPDIERALIGISRQHVGFLETMEAEQAK